MPRYSYVSLVLIALSIAVSVLSQFGESTSVLTPLFISSSANGGFQDILQGEIWRLITPVFIHFGLMHLVFNMMWVWDLGKLIERKRGVHFYLILIVCISSISNIAQYAFTGSPYFGGMSGVVYGMFGYVWMRGRYDPHFSSDMNKSTVVMMLIWFAACWTGLLGPIANWAHTAGLLIGIIWGYVGRHAISASDAASSHEMQQQMRLRYLSAADVLEMEEQKRWVKNQCGTHTQQKFDNANDKIGTIRLILEQGKVTLSTPKELHSLEIVFGDALAQETGAQWACMETYDEKTPVLFLPHSNNTVFQLNTITQLIQQNRTDQIETVFIQNNFKVLSYAGELRHKFA